jgi:hypothetical protein
LFPDIPYLQSSTSTALPKPRQTGAAIDLSGKRNGAAMWLDYKNQPFPMQAEHTPVPAGNSTITGKDAEDRCRVDSSGQENVTGMSSPETT